MNLSAAKALGRADEVIEKAAICCAA